LKKGEEQKKPKYTKNTIYEMFTKTVFVFFVV